MKDYSNLGLSDRMVKKDSLMGRDRGYVKAIDDDVKVEKSPYLPPVSISRGTFQTNSGGMAELKDTTGGTTLFTVDPDTGTVTIAGPVQANVTLNIGTINNTSIAGAGTISGTINNTRLINNGTYNNGTLGTPAITGGTVASGVINNPTVGTPAVTGGTLNSVYQTGGLAGSSGSIIYVKTVDFVGSAVTLGTLNFTGGLVLTFS